MDKDRALSQNSSRFPILIASDFFIQKITFSFEPMNHIVTISLVIFSLTQMSVVHQHSVERLRLNYERADALARSILTVTVSLDDQDQQVALLNKADQLLPQITSVTLTQKYRIDNYTGACTTKKESVKNNSP